MPCGAKQYANNHLCTEKDMLYFVVFLGACSAYDFNALGIELGDRIVAFWAM